MAAAATAVSTHLWCCQAHAIISAGRGKEQVCVLVLAMLQST